MFRHPIRWSARPLLVLGLLLATACGGDSPSGPDPDPSPTLQCSNPSLGATEAAPFSRVPITGISGIDDNSYVEYETASGTKGFTAIVAKEGGGFEIVVPPNPDALMAGGSLTLTVTDGESTCEPLSIEVLPTAAVEGDPLADAMTTMGDLSDAFAAQFGLDPATLRSTTLDQLPPQAVPVAVLLEAYDAMEPATVLASLSADEQAFVQALIAESGIQAALQDALASIGPVAPAKTASSLLANRPTTTLRRKEGCSDLGVVPTDAFDLNTPEELSDLMKAARGAGDPNGPLNQAIGSFADAFGVIGLAAPNVGLVAGYLAFTARLIQNMRANLYPSAISRLEYQVDKDRIEEDWDTSKGDPAIKWRFAKVWATNNGMGLARVGVDLISTGAPIPGPFGNDVADGLFDMVGKNEINGRLDELENDPNSMAECWGVGVTEFGPIAIPEDSGEKWVRAELTSGDAISLEDADKRRIEPQKIGSTTLRVRTQPDPFPGPFGFQDKSIEVLRKQVVWIPSVLLVDNPGQDVTIKFRVDNSKHHDAVDVEITEGPNLPPLFPSQNGAVHEITFTTPTDESDYPTWVEARSLSKELPPDAPARSARIEILAKEFVKIDPKEVCVGAGKTETFTATAGGPGDPVVKWELVAGAGTLSTDTGLSVDYTAPPSGSGEATLRAYLEGKPEVEDFLSFRYGVCGGLAAYWGQNLDINFPFTSGPPCNNPDLDASFEDITYPKTGFEPLVPPAPGDIFVNRTETFSHQLSDGGSFGSKPPGQETCLYDSFTADASYSGSMSGSADGSRLDIDFSVSSGSEAKDMGPLGKRWSGATASMNFGARFDFDITQATDYRLQVQLNADIPTADFGVPLSGMLSIIPIQVEPDGTPVAINVTTQPIQIQATTGVPIVLDQIMKFVAPSTPGQADHVMVMVQMGVISMAAGPLDLGPVNKNGSIVGFVSVEQQ